MGKTPSLPGPRPIGKSRCGIFKGRWNPDNARGWACELAGLHPAWTLAEKLEILRPLAAEQEEAFKLLLPWPILEPLRADPSRHVQNSVANWLNDASRTCPEWVRGVCACRENESSPGKETAYIIRRALRTLRKSENPWQGRPGLVSRPESTQ